MFQHISTDAHDSHSSLNLNDVQINLRQKQITPPDCINNNKLQPEVLAEVEKMQGKVFGWKHSEN